jgi:pimeloyl-ACP methyl ester carboxylesterase
MRELAVSLGVLPKVLVGLGMGASLALTYLMQSGNEGVPKRIVLHTPAYYPGAIRPKARWATRFLASPVIFPMVAGILSHPAVREQFVRRLTAAPSADDHVIRSLLEDVDRASLRVLRGLASDMVRSDFRPLLGRMHAPTLAIVAEHDPFVYATEIMQLSTRFENVQVVVQRDVAHGWTANAIEQQNALLADFLSPSTV